MYGMITKITVKSGERDPVIGILGDCTTSLPGCLSYVIAQDAADADVIWVTEAWVSQAMHDTSLSLPRVVKAIAEARPRISQFERIAVTAPVRGVRG